MGAVASGCSDISISEIRGNGIVIPECFMDKFSDSEKVVIKEYENGISIEPINETSKENLIEKVLSLIR